MRILESFLGDSGYKAGDVQDRVPIHCKAQSHIHIENEQFREANQHTAHVFGLGKETGVPRVNPQSTGRNAIGTRQTCYPL